MLQARHAPADDGGFHRNAGLMVLPASLDIAAGERQLVRPAVILAQNFERQAGWWFSGAIEFRQTSFARCPSKKLP